MKNRALFLFSKGVSHIGTRLFTFSLSWYILSQTGSGLSFSISLLVNYLPAIVVSLFAGKISDKTVCPNRMLVLCDLASAAVCCILFFHLSLGAVYSVIFLLSAVSAVFNNVIDTHLIHLDGVDSKERLKKLTSLAQFFTSGINILAPAIGGFLIQVFSVQSFAIINALSFLVSAFGEIWLKYTVCQEEKPLLKEKKKKEKSVLSYMFGQKRLRTFFLADSLGNFCFSAGINVALPLIVTTVLGVSSRGYGVISGSIAAGSVLCAVWRAKFPSNSKLRYPFFKLGLLGGCMLALTVTAYFPGYNVVTVLSLLMLIVGWLTVDINIQTKTTLQLFVEPNSLGKVLGISTSISYLLIPLSLLIAGGITEILPAFVLPVLNGGVLIVGIGVLWIAERDLEK